MQSQEYLEQGDLLYRYPIPILPKSKPVPNAPIKATLAYYDCIVLSQTCDIIGGNISTVLICPLMPLEEYSKATKSFTLPQEREGIRRGHYPSRHMLNKAEYVGINDFLIVDFKTIYTVSLKVIRKQIPELNRIRLLSPYREHLSQSFAKFFMRVGLPLDIPPFI